MGPDGWGDWDRCDDELSVARAHGASRASQIRRRLGQDGWGDWDDEIPVAGALAAKRARKMREEDEEASSALPARPDSAVPVDVTVDDTGALDCGVCFVPLKPPIFQCDMGHMVCSPCCDKLKATGECHVCHVATRGYRRCHTMERLVESVHVRCPNAAHGCTVRPAYYDQRNHIKRCAHAPCHCPEEACGFIGSTAALWDHVSGVHSWPRSKGRAGKQFDICLEDGLDFILECMNVITLRDGFNFLLADCASDSNSRGTNSTATASSQYIFLLNVARQPLGRGISVLCIHPEAVAVAGDGQGSSSKEVKCELSYTGHRNSRPRECDQVIEHYQKSRFRVACTDLSDGLSSLDGCFQFVIQDTVAADLDGDAIQVTVRIVIE